MHDCAAVFLRVVNRRAERLFDPVDRRILRHQLVCPLDDDLAQQRRNVLKMIIERIAVDAAALNDVTHGNFVQRLFVQQLQKRRLDRLLRKVCHGLSFVSS